MNAKAVFEADTRDLTRGAKQARKEMKDFGKTTDDVTKSIGDAFGVDLDKLNQLSNSAKEFGRRLSESGRTGEAALGKLLQNLDATKVAIAGLGIGAAVSAFKLLTAEAENFKNTVAGANIEMQTAAYVSTYTQALHDFNSATGQSVAEFEANWKKGSARIWANFKQDFVNAMNGNMGIGQGLLGPVWGSVFGNREQRGAAEAKASQAETIAGQMFDITRQIAAKSVEWAETEAQIAEYRRIAKDDSAGLAAQQNAIAQAENLITQRYGEEYNLRKQMSDLQTQMVGLTGSSVADEDKMYSLQKQTADVLRQKETLLKSLDRDQKSINSAVAKEAEERRKAAAILEQERQVMAQRAEQLSGLTIGGAPSGFTPLNQVTGPEMTILVHPKVDEKEVISLAKEMESLVEQGAESTASAIGALIGDLATGGDAWTNFANAAVSSFGDMAIAVGKMAISTGAATIGIKTALESLNGYVAIAAGAALVALGTAVKTGMSNIASGNYSASASVASSGYGRGTGAGGYATSSINIKVTGTLVGDGSQLKGVIDSENSRRNTVT